MTNASNNHDLHFNYHIAKNGAILINHNNQLATILRGKQALKFTEQIQTLSFSQQQQLMARLTGNYKRGNERQAKNHPKQKS